MTPANGTTPPSLSIPRFVQEWLVFAVVVAVAFALSAVQLKRTHDRIEEDERARLQLQLKIVEDQLVRQLQGAANALAGLRYDLASGDTPSRPRPGPVRLKQLADAMPGVRCLAIVDAHGKVVETDRARASAGSFAGLAFFDGPARRHDDIALYVSRPTQPEPGLYAINLSKAVIDHDGAFAGVVTAALEPSYFDTAAMSIRYAEDMVVGVVHGDGVLFALAPRFNRLIGTDLSTHPTRFTEHMASGRVQSLFRGPLSLVQEDRLTALRTVAPATLHLDKPLVLGASRRVEDIFAVWQREAMLNLAMLLVVSASSGLALRFSQQRRRVAGQAAQERRQAEREHAQCLYAAAELQRRTGELAKVGGWSLDVATKTVEWTEEMFPIHDWAPPRPPTHDEWLGMLAPQTRLLIRETLRDAIQHGTGWDLELEMLTAGRRRVWIRTQGERVRMPNGALRLLGAFQDVTERVAFERELQEANARLSRLTLTDGLTGVGNRRLFETQLVAEWARAQRQGQPLALLMIDVDHFKPYNDHYGHLQGDEALRTIATRLASCARRSGELVARYGGEEFAVLLPGADAAAAHDMARACAATLFGAALPHAASPVSDRITLSIGVASAHPAAAGGEARHLVEAADQALYAAKQQGRNRIATRAS